MSIEQPPSDEQVLVATALDLPAASSEILELVRLDQIENPKLREILAAIRGAVRDGEEVATGLIAKHLRDRGTLDKVGGLAHLFELAEDALTSTTNVPFVAASVCEASDRRRLARLIRRAQAGIVEKEDPSITAKWLREGIAELDGAGTASSGAFPVIYHTEQPDPPNWIVEGMIEAGTACVLGAEPKVGKTWVTIDMAIAMAAGQQFLGHEIKTRGKTLFYSPEGSGRSLAARIHGLCWGRNLDPREIARSLPFIAARLDLAAEGHAQRLADTIDETGATGVVIDPMVSASMGVDENSATDVMSILNPLRDILTARPRCFLLVAHHTNKGAKSTSRSLGLRGSSALHGWLDTLITLRRKDDDSGSTRRVDIAHRDAEDVPAFGFDLVSGPVEDSQLDWFRLDACEAPALTNGKSVADGPTAKRDLEQQILELVAANDKRLSRHGVAKELRASHTRINSACIDLESAGSIHIAKSKIHLGPPKPSSENLWDSNHA